MPKSKVKKPATEESSEQPPGESSAVDSMTMLENFEQELQWCVDQLQLGLERQNPDSKQALEAVKVLKILQSSKAPLVKKRQAMRNTFGDYRAKMRKEQTKSAAAAKKMKLSAVDQTGYQKSQFFKKSSSQKSQTQSTQSATNVLDIAESKNNNSGADLNESFKFNFSISENSNDNLGESSSKYGAGKLNDTEQVVASSSSHLGFKMQKSDNTFQFNFDMTDKT